MVLRIACGEDDSENIMTLSRLLFSLVKLYSWIECRGFARCGRNTIIKPILNSHNKKFISVGDNVIVGTFSWIGVSTEFSGVPCDSKNSIRLDIGSNVSIGNNAFIIANNELKIGSDVIISSYVFISDHSHRYDDIEKSPHEQPLTVNGFVRIGNNVFIGTKSSVLQNVCIGDHAVIGANTVVTKDIPAYSVAVGNPARVVKKYDFAMAKWVGVE